MARNSATGVIRASMAMSRMMVEAQTVIGLRMMGMMGFWNLGPGEHARMWSEKADATRQGGVAAVGAAMRGVGPVGIAMAAVNPVRRRTRANVRRLMGRGPSAP